MANSVGLPTRIVIGRPELSLAEARSIGDGESMQLGADDRCCELEAGGVVVATGELVPADSGWRFKVTGGDPREPGRRPEGSSDDD